MEQANAFIGHGVFSCNAEEEDELNLPPGFRFHPTDEELITHYLSKKVVDASFDPRAIGEVDLNKSEPWELPRRAKLGEKELYFFCLRDRKYLTGIRTNRATHAGYWKATGKDREIYRGKLLVGMKKTLVFYRGRAPRGEKSNWVMHEFRLEGKSSVYSHPRIMKNEWVICRVIKKLLNGNGNKTFGETARACSSSSYGEEVEDGHPPPALTPFKDIPAHVSCFSSPAEGQKAEDPEPFSALRCFNSSLQFAPACFPSDDVSSLSLSRFTPLESAAFYGGRFMSLLEGDFTVKQGRKMEREMLGVSHGTELAGDMMSAQTSSGTDIGRTCFEEFLWNC